MSAPILVYLSDRSRFVLTQERPPAQSVVMRLGLEVMDGKGMWSERTWSYVPESKLADLSIGLAQYRARHGITL